MSSKKPTYAAIYDVIMKNMNLLKKHGAFTARPGYQISGGKVIDKPAIVVTVAKKKKGLPAKDKLPAEIGDIPVDVRNATPMQLLREKDPDSFHIIQALGPRELHEPESKWECSMQTGKPVAQPSATVMKLISPPAGKKTAVPYTAPVPVVPLDPVTDKITITAYASPDDGYTVLSSFLKQTKKQMTIGMYDFTSGDLLNDVIGTIKPDMNFTMVLDDPAKNETAVQTDPQTRSAILANDSGAAINWALDNMSPEVTGEIYPYAYHIKVVVSDQSSFWLSSGNFNVSNQPNFAANDPKRGSFQTSDRDWHVIVEHKGLAQVFEKYIEHDFTVAGNFQANGAQLASKQTQLAIAKTQRQSLNAAMKQLHAIAKTAAAPGKVPFTNAPSTKGKHQEFANAQVTIQPLLTPDPGQNTTMYVEHVLHLIQSAETSIFIQMQYITPPPKAANGFSLLLQALGDAFAKGLDVRIIVSEYQKDAATEQLSEWKLDQVLRKQNRVHNKGIIVDGKRVLVSSQNWSSDGVLSNRDAGVIIENGQIAEFFQEIFMDDWTTRAK
jgi:hypothetical protein